MLIIWRFKPVIVFCNFCTFLSFIFKSSYYLLVCSNFFILSLSPDILSSIWSIQLVRFSSEFPNWVIEFSNSIVIWTWILFNTYSPLLNSTFQSLIAFNISFSLLFVFLWASLRCWFYLSSLLLLLFFNYDVLWGRISSLHNFNCSMEFMHYLLVFVFWYSFRQFSHS